MKGKILSFSTDTIATKKKRARKRMKNMQCYSQFIFIQHFASQSHKQNGYSNIIIRRMNELGVLWIFLRVFFCVKSDLALKCQFPFYKIQSITNNLHPHSQPSHTALLRTTYRKLIMLKAIFLLSIFNRLTWFSCVCVCAWLRCSIREYKMPSFNFI